MCLCRRQVREQRAGCCWVALRAKMARACWCGSSVPSLVSALTCARVRGGQKGECPPPPTQENSHTLPLPRRRGVAGPPTGAGGTAPLQRHSTRPLCAPLLPGGGPLAHLPPHAPVTLAHARTPRPQAQAQRYQDQSRLLYAGLRAQFNSSTYSDIIVVAPSGARVFCHQVVLAACSKKFAAVLDAGGWAGRAGCMCVGGGGQWNLCWWAAAGGRRPCVRSVAPVDRHHHHPAPDDDLTCAARALAPPHPHGLPACLPARPRNPWLLLDFGGTRQSVRHRRLRTTTTPRGCGCGCCVCWPAAGEAAGKELPIQGVDSSALEAVLGFFYSGECVLSPTTAVPMLDVCLKLEVGCVWGGGPGAGAYRTRGV